MNKVHYFIALHLHLYLYERNVTFSCITSSSTICKSFEQKFYSLRTGNCSMSIWKFVSIRSQSVMIVLDALCKHLIRFEFIFPSVMDTWHKFCFYPNVWMTKSERGDLLKVYVNIQLMMRILTSITISWRSESRFVIVVIQALFVVN